MDCNNIHLNDKFHLEYKIYEIIKHKLKSQIEKNILIDFQKPPNNNTIIFLNIIHIVF